jgi:hypothetical protein
MIAKSGTMFEHPIIIACDAKCHKAWGHSNRPCVYLDEQPPVIRGHGFINEYPDFEKGDGRDIDNHAMLADDELPDAPENPGTYEGDEGKPRTPEQRLNKWCARECERSVIIDDVFPVKDFELPDFSQRQYNIAPHTRKAQS